MSKKTQPQRAIDTKRGLPDAGEVIATTANTLPPALSIPGAPENLAVGTMTIGRSSASPVALVPIVWTPPLAVPATSYLVEVATDSGFTNVVLRATALDLSATLELKPGTTFYVRVYAQTLSVLGAASAAVSFTTPTDTSAAGVPTSAAASFIGAGDLRVTWTNPTDENLRDVEVRIWNSSGKTTLYHTGYAAGGSYTWTAAQNRADTSGTPDPVVYVELRSRTWSLVLGTAVVVGTITKSAPSTPGSSAADFTGRDCIFSWAAAADAARYRLTIDSVARDIDGTRYVYTFDQNRVEHTGTADPSLSWSLVAIDALDQVSTAATGTATNAAPSAPGSVAIAGGFSALAVTVTATQPADFLAYRYRLIQTSPSAGDVTWDSPTAFLVRQVTAAATYQMGVKVVDEFGQASTETLSSTTVLDALTLADLREAARYSDSGGTAAATLKAALADDVKSSGGVSYASNASWVRWIRFERDLLERYQTITLAMVPSSGTTNWYLRTSQDGSTWSYFAGPVTSSRIITAVADAAAAQAAAISAATLGDDPNLTRVDLPAITEARYVELWLRNTGASTRVDEFYPRRLVQSDDIEAESIKAINIAAASITADRLSVLQLSAITADMGTITAGTITGATIQTAASGARIELTSANGLRAFNSGGTVQAQINTSDGRLKAGGGSIVLSSNAMQLVGTGSTARVAFRATEDGTLYGDLRSDGNVIAMVANTGGGDKSIGIDRTTGITWMSAEAVIGTAYTVRTQRTMLDVLPGGVFVDDGGTPGTAGDGLTVGATGGIPKLAPSGSIAATGGLNVGYVSGSTDAGTGEIRATGAIYPPRSSGSALFGVDASSQGTTIAVVNNTSVTPFGNANNFSGIVIVTDTATDGAIGVFAVGGGAIAEISDPSALFTTTSGNGGTYNVYLAAGVVTLENRRGSGRTVSVFGIRTRTSN